MGPLGVAIPLPRRAARKRFAQIAQLVEQGTENPRVAGAIPALGTTCGHSSSGRAPPCQGGGSEFEPRCPLQKETPTLETGVGVSLKKVWTFSKGLHII